MGQIKLREDRQPLLLPARLLVDEGWQDAIVCNVSSRGMMLRCAMPPERNSFIEVRYKNLCFVGRVVWSSGSQCGIRTQDNIDYSQLMCQSPTKATQTNAERGLRPRDDLKQANIRVLPPEDSSKIFARIFDFSALALGVVLGAIMLADVVGGALGPLIRIQTVLANQQSIE
jgi:hypothetical protein